MPLFGNSSSIELQVKSLNDRVICMERKLLEINLKLDKIIDLLDNKSSKINDSWEEYMFPLSKN